MELSKEDIILLQAFIGSRLDELERNALLTRFQNEPTLRRDFEIMTDKELSSFIRQYEREKLRRKLESIREQAADDFENIYNDDNKGSKFRTPSKILFQADYARITDVPDQPVQAEDVRLKNISDKPKKKIYYPNYSRVAAIIVLIAFIGGLGFWYFDEEDKFIKVADKNQTLDSIKLDSEGNPNDTTSNSSTNTNKNSTGGNRGFEENESRIILKNIRVIIENNLGFIPQAIRKDSLLIILKTHNEDAKYSCNEAQILLLMPPNNFEQFRKLTARQFAYVSDSHILQQGLYFKEASLFYYITCDNTMHDLAKSVVSDLEELEELKELFKVDAIAH
jgi:archaellum component FlaF (FlaF/FlaG flagellin family)